MPLFLPVEKICGKAVNSLWKVCENLWISQISRTKSVDKRYPQDLYFCRTCKKKPAVIFIADLYFSRMWKEKQRIVLSAKLIL
jgi:hypothetical protein